ncbi:hypothetical protein DFH28DRAFT_883960, partial [Melampsora americana]
PVQSTLHLSLGHETDDNVPHRSEDVTTPACLGLGIISPPSYSGQYFPRSLFTFSANNCQSLTSKGQEKGKGK